MLRPPLQLVLVNMWLWLSVTALLLSVETRLSAAKPPNILFILSDDLGYGDLEMYPNPHSPHGRVSTPYIKSLASQGMTFTDAYAGAPVCAPSRCALMTGRHTGHCTVRENGQVLADSDVTIASVLQKAGYNTGLIGKWGLGSTDYPPATNVPNPEGFDFFLGYNSQENAHNYYPHTLVRNKGQISFPENSNASEVNCGQPLTQNCTWAEDVFVNTTVEFLSNSSKSESPFFLFLSFTSPHAGGIGTNEETGVPAPYDTPQYGNQSWPKVERDFASVITLQDIQVGQIVKELDNLGLGNNTVIFFASDNGAHNEGGHSYQFFESSGPLRGYKRSLHEGGVRSPLIIRWSLVFYCMRWVQLGAPIVLQPGVVEPGAVVQQQWGFWDFLATAADIAGVPLGSLPVNDGYSLLPTLQGHPQDQPKYIYHEYCYPNEDKSGWGQAVRFMNWKAVRYNSSPAVELYDLVNDVGETTDVSGDSPDVVRLAVEYMEDAHSPGPDCGYLPPHPNNYAFV